jgi:hypothetical protein
MATLPKADKQKDVEKRERGFYSRAPLESSCALAAGLRGSALARRSPDDALDLKVR